MKPTVCAILLAGGKGTRMQSTVPKQFLPINEKPLARYSFDTLAEIPEICEIVVVCDPIYRHLFESSSGHPTVTFALPGEQRQDSVWNGLNAIKSNAEYVCIHDAARPVITPSLVIRVLEAAYQHGAATVGMPIKFTIKEHDGTHFVKQTPDRSRIWEIQTPQVMKTLLIKQGLEEIREKKLTVTDDVSVIEYLNLPVKLVEGCYSNLKVTTNEDLFLAERFCGLVNCEHA